MLAKAREIKPFIVNLRRAIHRRPELGFDVHETAALVARTLGELGIEAQTGVGKTGVVGYLGEAGGPVVGIRADMDALPILEANDVPYRSEIAGRMHACGHDAHTAMLLGAARLLTQEKFKGQIRLLFQPSEEDFDTEGVSGAPRMIADGALQGVQRVIALHVDGMLETGSIGIEAGKVAAAVDTFRATITGKGGHGARPHVALDPIWLTTQVLNALYAVPSRRIDPLEPNVLTVGIVQAGTAENVIPPSVYLEGTLRSMEAETRAALHAEVERCLHIARALGGDYQLEIVRGYPPMFNDAGVCEVIGQVGRDLLGEGGLAPREPTMGAEDFSYMLELAPGAMFRLGVRQPGGPPRYVHTPDFDIDEDALPIGAAMLAETALRLLRELER
ncbi:MAG: M20 family metallopeptidase [Anaerolineales bacterium]|nr:M20 family metallopeptidase [Anaerolineales bacterium]